MRWSRAHREEVGDWAVGLFIRDSLGTWVDGVNKSPPWFHHHDHGHDVDSHSHTGHHGHSDGGSSGDVIGP
ncbi:MAG: hypothetical protein QM723_10175 [Myxococcaceae bacterium]